LQNAKWKLKSGMDPSTGSGLAGRAEERMSERLGEREWASGGVTFGIRRGVQTTGDVVRSMERGLEGLGGGSRGGGGWARFSAERNHDDAQQHGGNCCGDEPERVAKIVVPR